MKQTPHVLVSLLREYKNVFTFGLKETLGIDPSVMEHRLNADLTYTLVGQKKRHMGVERSAVATVEVQKLLDAGVIREFQYLEWILNVVLVKNPNGFWRRCMDFIDLNKTYRKDN